MAKKRTKAEALERLAEARAETGRVPLKGRAKFVRDAAFLGAAGLIMLDPLDRLADAYITVPMPMIAIPAHEAYLLSGNPSLQIYIRAGETIVPTGGDVQDVAEGQLQAEAMQANAPSSAPTQGSKKAPTKYQKRYKREFEKAKASGKYTLKNGNWAKNGFKRCVKAAHAATKKALQMDGPSMTHGPDGKRSRRKY